MFVGFNRTCNYLYIFQVLNNQYQMKHKAIECSQKRKKEGKEGCKWNFICFCPYEAHKYQLWPHCLGGVTTHNTDPYHQKRGHLCWLTSCSLIWEHHWQTKSWWFNDIYQSKLCFFSFIIQAESQTCLK